jgi:hypothetical protein
MGKTRKIPKTFAGVKIPKSLRRGLRDLAKDRHGRMVLTEAFIAAGSALAATRTNARAKAKAAAAEPAPKVETPSEALSETLSEAPANARTATVMALEDAARSFTEALRQRGLSEPPIPVAPPASTATH